MCNVPGHLGTLPIPFSVRRVSVSVVDAMSGVRGRRVGGDVGSVGPSDDCCDTTESALAESPVDESEWASQVKWLMASQVSTSMYDNPPKPPKRVQGS